MEDDKLDSSKLNEIVKPDLASKSEESNKEDIKKIIISHDLNHLKEEDSDSSNHSNKKENNGRERDHPSGLGDRENFSIEIFEQSEDKAHKIQEENSGNNLQKLNYKDKKYNGNKEYKIVNNESNEKNNVTTSQKDSKEHIKNNNKNSNHHYKKEIKVISRRIYEEKDKEIDGESEREVKQEHAKKEYRKSIKPFENEFAHNSKNDLVNHSNQKEREHIEMNQIILQNENKQKEKEKAMKDPTDSCEVRDVKCSKNYKFKYDIQCNNELIQKSNSQPFLDSTEKEVSGKEAIKKKRKDERDGENEINIDHSQKHRGEPCNPGPETNSFTNHETANTIQKGKIQYTTSGKFNHLFKICIYKKCKVLLKLINLSANDCLYCKKRSLQKVISFNLRAKYLTTLNSYYNKVTNDIIFNENTHIVSVFKDYLIYDDTSEFLKRYYLIKESKPRLPRIFNFYDCSSKVFPNYINLPESRILFRNIERKQALIDEKQHLVEVIAKKKRMKSTSKNKITDESNKIFTSGFLQKLNEKNQSGSLDNDQSVNKSNSLMNSYLKALKGINANMGSLNPHRMKLEEILSDVIQKDSQSNLFHSISEISFDLSKPALQLSNPKLNRENDLNPRKDYKTNVVQTKDGPNFDKKVGPNGKKDSSKDGKEFKVISNIRNRNKIEGQPLTCTNRGSNPSVDKEPDKPKILTRSPENVNIKVKKMKLLHNSKVKLEADNSNKGNVRSKDQLMMNDMKSARLTSNETSKKDEELLSNKETFIYQANKKPYNISNKKPSIKDMKRALSIPEIHPNFIKEATLKAEKARNEIINYKMNSINSNKSSKKEIPVNQNSFPKRAKSLEKNEHKVGIAENTIRDKKGNLYLHANKKINYPSISSTPKIKKVKEPELKEINKLNLKINPISARLINPTETISPYLIGNIEGNINPKNIANNRKKKSPTKESFLKRQGTDIVISQNKIVNNRDEYLVKRENFQRKMSNPLEIIKLTPYVTNITKKEKLKNMNQEILFSNKYPKNINPLQKIEKTTNKIQRHCSVPSVFQQFH